MSYFGAGGGNNGGRGAGGGTNPQLLTGPQLFVNSNQLQFQTPTGQSFFSQEGSQLQLSAAGTPLLLQPPVNLVTDVGVGLGQLISQAGGIMSLGNVLESGGSGKQKVFTGTVTKIHDNFGFIDDEVFFQMGVVKGPILPKEGDRVLVEADFNPSMPFKWTATRVQIVNIGGGGSSAAQGYQSSGYSSASKQITVPSTLAGGRPQGVGVGSSIYSSGMGAATRMPSLSDSLMSGRSRAPMPESSHMSSVGLGLPGLPSLMQKDMGRDRDRDREKDRDRERERRDRDREHRRDRSRSRERERSRERDRDRRERSRSRDRDRMERSRRSRSRERERRRRTASPKRSRSRERERDRAARERSMERERERERRVKEKERERSPVLKPLMERIIRRSRSRDTVKSSEGKGSTAARDRSRSRERPVLKAPTRYVCEPPQYSLDTMEFTCCDLKMRYKDMYIPSDLFLAKACWVETFPIIQPLEFLGSGVQSFVMGRRVERLDVNFDDEPGLKALQDRFNDVPHVLNPPDASCTFSVKVLLLSVPTLDTVFRKLGFVLNNGKADSTESSPFGVTPLQKLLSFVIGLKTGKNDVTALGGNWSPSLDGPDPQSNPRVLINTAVRCCKALGSIDLTRCKHWYRFMELYYRRSNGNLETVVYFIPDLSSCLPSYAEWDRITKAYKLALYGPNPDGQKVSDSQKNNDVKPKTEKNKLVSDNVEMEDNCDIDKGDTDGIQIIESTAPSDNGTAPVTETPTSATGITSFTSNEDTGKDTADRLEVVDECNGGGDMDEDGETSSPTKIDRPDGEGNMGDRIAELPQDLNHLTVAKLRDELAKRSLNTKGLKAQLVSRLHEALDSNASRPTQYGAGDSATWTSQTEGDQVGALRLVDPSKILETSVDEGGQEDNQIPNENSGKLQMGVMKHDSKPELFKGSTQMQYPLIKPEMPADEKSLLERRYALPKNPRVLIFPASKISSSSSSLKKTVGPFDCTMMTLATLRTHHRDMEKKEDAFEVALMAEMFYEMLQRDFGFKIYAEVVKQAAAPKIAEKEEQQNHTPSNNAIESEPAAKRPKGLSPEVTEKMKTVDPLLLLAFTFFDENQAGHIHDDDLESICTSLGLGLTRHEVEKLLRKVTSKGSQADRLFYRKWTDKSEEELAKLEKTVNDESLLITEGKSELKHDPDFLVGLAKGNKSLLPVFTYSKPVVHMYESDVSQLDLERKDTKESLVVNVDGQYIDVTQLRTQAENMNREKIAAEANANALKNALTEAKNQVSELRRQNESLNEEVKKISVREKKFESTSKSNQEMLDIFKKASESYINRIKDFVKLPNPSRSDEKKPSKDKDKEASDEKKKDLVTENSKGETTVENQ